MNQFSLSTYYLLDTCSLVCLAGTERLNDIIIDTELRYAVSEIIVKESKFYRKSNSIGQEERITLDLESIIQKNLIKRIDILDIRSQHILAEYACKSN
jgi:hypothetical protein